MRKPCIDKIELPNQMRDYIISQREFNAKKGLSEKESDLLSAKSLQEKALDELHNLYHRTGVEGYDKVITETSKKSQNSINNENDKKGGKSNEDVNVKTAGSQTDKGSDQAGSEQGMRKDATLKNEEGAAGKSAPSIQAMNIFDAIEKADRSKISQREKLKAAEESVSEFGNLGKKALEIHSNFDNIVEDLKRQNKLKVKC